MRLVFGGTPEFAAVALEALHRAGHEIALVLTQPDRPSGRGLQATPSPVKRAAAALRLPLKQPLTLKDPVLQGELRRVQAEIIVIAAYGLMVPQAILDTPRRGCINIHASLLPRWRGAAPIQRAILAGDAQTGISIMQMDAGLDTGPVLLREATDIANDDTAQTLHDRLAIQGAALLVQALESHLKPLPQDQALATYAAKLDKREALIDWNEAASSIGRKVRAFNPAPGASTSYEGVSLKLWQARPRAVESDAAPGTIIAVTGDALTIACGAASALEVTQLQRAGGKRLAAAAFLAGCRLRAGGRLGV